MHFAFASTVVAIFCAFSAVVAAPSQLKFPHFGKKGASTAIAGAGAGAAAGAAASAPIAQTIKGAYDVKSAIAAIDADVVALGRAVSSFNGDSFAALALMKQTDVLIGHIQQGVTGMKHSRKLTIDQGFQILPVFKTFIPDTQRTVKELSRKQKAFVKAAVVGIVLDKITQIHTLGAQFDDAVVSKLDKGEKQIGKDQYAPINKALTQSLMEFQALAKQYPNALGTGSAATAASNADAAAIAAADAGA